MEDRENLSLLLLNCHIRIPSLVQLLILSGSLSSVAGWCVARFNYRHLNGKTLLAKSETSSLVYRICLPGFTVLCGRWCDLICWRAINHCRTKRCWWSLYWPTITQYRSQTLSRGVSLYLCWYVRFIQIEICKWVGYLWRTFIRSLAAFSISHFGGHVWFLLCVPLFLWWWSSVDFQSVYYRLEKIKQLCMRGELFRDMSSGHKEEFKFKLGNELGRVSQEMLAEITIGASLVWQR